MAILFVFLSITSSLQAAGGGENMLLIVNPTDEPSLRIANAYVKARNIPINNILYIDPSNGGGAPIGSSPSAFISTYQSAVPAAIAARGLSNQIDYIGTLGQPHFLSSTYVVGFHATLNHLTQLNAPTNALTIDQVLNRQSELTQSIPSTTKIAYTTGSNPAIYHSQQLVALSGSLPLVQWYMTGMVGNTTACALSTAQAIQNLERTVKGDGTNPQGTVYYEYSDSTRGGTRSPYWPPVQTYMDQVGIPWLRENVIESPKNRAAVRGAVVGTGNTNTSTQIINGSAYTPGSWADNMTSFGGLYGGPNQTKVSGFLLGGAGGAAGTVNEPYAIQSRFTYASIYLFSNDGSTLGESFYKSVTQPDLLMFEGDLLSQAYADVPSVAFTSGPADGATVSGGITLSGSARLNNPRIATGIARLKLFVDGLPSGSMVNAASGSFSLDTTALTDGVHEVRIVAYNNSLAASEGYFLKNIVVNNKNQSVSITGTGIYYAGWNQSLSIPVSAIQGSGTAITAIQLQSLGRMVGSISASSGTIPLDVTKLAYGSNTITPVAILASGTQQVQGTPIAVTRRFLQFPGTPPTPVAKRNPGCDYYFFTNGAGSNSTLSTINFNATPSYAFHANGIGLNPGSTYSPGSRNFPDAYRQNYTGYQMAVMIKCSFSVATSGEYMFFPGFGSAYTSAGVYVDGTLIYKRDDWNGSYCATVVPSQAIYLLPGEHTLVIKLGQSRSGRSDYECTSSFYWRGPDGNTLGAGGPTFYTTSKRLSP